MSDYLASIVARNLEVGDRLQPRPISKFEPVAAGPADRQISSPDQLSQIEEHVFVDADASVEHATPPRFVQESRESTNAADAPLHHTEPASPALHVTRRGAPPEAAAHPRPLDRAVPTPPTESAAATQPSLVPNASAQTSPRTPGAQTRPSHATTEAAPPTHVEETPSTLTPVAASSPRRRKAGERPADVPVSIEVSSVRRVVQRRAVPSTSLAPIEARSAADAQQAVTAAPSRGNDAAGQPSLKAASTEVSPASTALASPKARRNEPPLAADRDDVIDRTPPTIEAPRPILPLEVHVRPESSPADALTPHVMAAPEPTTIHVTIGRIEVRATPETSRKRIAAASAVPSLDDYLRRRAEGSGR